MPSDLQGWVSHPICLFWSSLQHWQRFVQFAQVWTSLEWAHLPAMVLCGRTCQRSQSWGLLREDFILAHRNQQQHFFGGGRRGQSHLAVQQDALKAHYMGPDPMPRLSVKFWNGAMVDTEALHDSSGQASLSQMTLRRELSFRVKEGKSAWILQKQTHPILPRMMTENCKIRSWEI